MSRLRNRRFPLSGVRGFAANLLIEVPPLQQKEEALYHYYGIT